MPVPIAIFYHCLFALERPENILNSALAVVYEQMAQLTQSGLADAASKIYVGVNGGLESELLAGALLPKKSEIVYHGLTSRGENLTIASLENWVREHDDEWNILYFHSKGATHELGSSYGDRTCRPWRHGMMDDLVINWKKCVAALDNGNDIACSHWMWSMADGSQHIPAGNFLWLKASFARKLPSIFLRERIKLSGVSALESRYEAEVYWGNGPRPKVAEFRPGGGNGVP